MERWLRQKARESTAPPDDLPVVLASEGPHGPVIHAANRAARLAGAHEGARVVDARATCPALRVEYADITGDRQALEHLMLWARRWCPWTAVDGAAGLILDTTGADHLMGGEAEMLEEMESRLSLLGLSAQLAVAPTWGAAWALARYGPVRARCGAEEIADMLAPLPVAALRLDRETRLLLHRLGLRTIGALLQVPRLSLTRRFARAALPANPLLRLDQATGALAEPVASPAPPPRIRAVARLAEPIMDPSAHLEGLCADICTQLAQAGLGCRHLRLCVYHTDGEVSHVEAATAAPTREAAHLCRLFEGRLERINPGYGFDLITLEAGRTEPLELTQTRLDGAAEADLQLPRLIDRLSARLGARAVTRPALRQSHVPERAQTALAALASPPEATEISEAAPPRERPLRLLRPPEEVRVLYAVPEGPPVQFIWRRQSLRVTRYAGPERIAPEWWRDRPGTRLRDYFKVEDQGGRRLWLYREGLHDDGRGGAPRWFVHGMFA